MLLENKGFKLIEADLPETIHGMTCRVEYAKSSPINVIMIDRHINVERKRFTLAHELAHQIITDTNNPNLKKEKAMNRFAAAFLIPREHLEEEIGKNRHRMIRGEIMRLKRIYGVSAAAMLMRLGQADILPKNTVEYAFKTYARKWRLKEPEPLKPNEGFASFEKSQRFEKLVWEALGERLISPLRAAQLLQISLNQIEHDIKGSPD